MRSRPRLRLTIAEVMALIPSAAAVLTLPRLQTRAEVAFAALMLAALPVFVLACILADLLIGIRCPGCGRWTMRRVALRSSYYRCLRCLRRYKRDESFLTSGPWLDASGPEDAAVFRGKAGRTRWAGYSVPQPRDDDATTTGVLVRHRRRRSSNEASSRGDPP
jgi:hypothetical protein